MRNSLAFTLRRVVNEFWELLQIQSMTLIAGVHVFWQYAKIKAYLNIDF